MKKWIYIIIAGLIFSACEKEDEQGSLSLTIKGVNQNYKSEKKATTAEVKITDFRLSFRDIEFKKDESDLDSNEVQFRGPYDVDLMDDNDALSQTIGNVDVPDGTYKVLRFKLHKDEDRAQSDPLYDRSLYMKGTIDGTPFEFWHDTSENFDIEKSDGILVNGNAVNVTVRFNMDVFLNAVHTIDLTQAKDDNGNGIIEINPDDDDNNGDIADNIKENIKMAADLIKE